MTIDPIHCFRVLIVDDNEAIHDDLKKILLPRETDAEFAADEALFFGTTPTTGVIFEIDSAFQGRDGLACVLKAKAAGRPYALAFVDVRMPPGWDGVETIGHLWQVDPDLQIVICTAYSDYNWNDISERLGISDNYVVLKKPFDIVEVVQLAHALTAKWTAMLDARVRTEELVRQDLELIKHRDHLEEEVASRTSELIEARDKAEAASRSKSEFLANMSHEIRTPLNGVIGMTDVALDSEPGKQQREYLETIKLSANSLLAIINDILDFSKIEAGKMDLEMADFNLPNCLEEAVRCLAVTALEHRIELLCDIAADIPEMVRGDPARLRQIVINLVGNAIKFTTAGEVSLRAEIDHREVDTPSLHFTVTDTGIGIPLSKQKTIFSPFVQADSSTTRNYGGTGLGLSICTRLIAMMGGKIWVESELGRGSAFHFIVPLEFLTSNPSRPEVEEKLRGVRVLIVEDNATSRRILKEILTAHGVIAHAVEGGEQALAELHRSSAADRDLYQLVLTDSKMADMDGFSLIEKIRGIPRLDTPSIIMLTSVGIDDVNRCSELGIECYLLKPIRKVELLSAVAKVISHGGADLGASTHVGLVRSNIGLNILLAEDNRINQMVGARTLERMGHSVAIANNGFEALALMAENRFDLVLMDIQMPRMDGLTTTDRIRQGELQGHAHIPIIALTAHAMKGDRERYLESGMDGYVSKPIIRSELEKAIADLVKV